MGNDWSCLIREVKERIKKIFIFEQYYLFVMLYKTKQLHYLIKCFILYKVKTINFKLPNFYIKNNSMQLFILSLFFMHLDQCNFHWLILIEKNINLFEYNIKELKYHDLSLKINFIILDKSMRFVTYLCSCT